LAVQVVSPDYLATMGIPLRQGRGLSADDTLGSQPVALIDEAAASHYWPGASPIGQQFRYTFAAAPHSAPVTVVGVVGHVKTLSYAAATGSVQVYLPAAQQPASATSLVLRVDGDPGATLGAISRLATSLDSRSAMNQPAVVAEMYGDTYVAPRFYVTVVSIFAALALATASVGLFSLLSYAVGERTREIGVRVALGADRRRIQLLVLADAMAPVAAGLMAGLVASLWLTRTLKAVLFGITPHDLGAYATAVVALIAAAALAALLPARRATHVDPVVALREG
jgi:ABC-type antimicrobial peptide transport system permease subunit